MSDFQIHRAEDGRGYRDVFLDGVLQKCVVEAKEGEDGYVVRMALDPSGRAVFDSVSDSVVYEREAGNVRVVCRGWGHA